MNSIKKNTSTTDRSPMRYARVAGILYILLVPLSIFGIQYVPSTLIVPGDAAATARNILASESLYRLSIVSALTVQIVNIFVVLFLYKLLKPVNKNMASLMVIFLLIAVPIAMFNELNRLAVLLVLGGADSSTAFTTGQLQNLMTLFTGLYKSGTNIAGIFWGLWLFPMGYLVFKSRFLPKLIGILLIIGCFGYLADSVIFFLVPNFHVTISQFTFIGEILLPLWLLIKGVNVEQWEKRRLETA